MNRHVHRVLVLVLTLVLVLVLAQHGRVYRTHVIPVQEVNRTVRVDPDVRPLPIDAMRYVYASDTMYVNIGRLNVSDAMYVNIRQHGYCQGETGK